MPLRREWTWEFPVARERLWEYLGDTDWVNEHARLPRITARYEPLQGGSTRRLASLRRWPFTFEWEERPTFWQAPAFHEVERIYSRGPLSRFWSRTTLEALAAQRTHVRVEVELTASSPVLRVLLPLIAAEGKRGADRAFRRAAEVASRTPRTPDNAEQALTAFLATAEDRDVRRMRPYELADRWNLPRRDVLRAFLSATRAGKLNLRWSVLCPGCRGASAGVETLEALQRGNHCDACNVSFEASFDRSVEVTFDARPMRPGLEADALFCIASPQRSPHVHAQRAVAAGSLERAELQLSPGTYDVNAVGLYAVPFIVSSGGPAPRELPVRITAEAVSVPYDVSDGTVRVSIENASSRDALIRIEDGRWPDTIVTAAQVTALQEFRDLFSSEVLSPGLELGIETIAVLFTDLVGSTAMYSRTGDAPAFRIVSDHFGVIRDIVARYEGAIVKTIGDAVMAVFVNPANCFKAAVELDEKVQAVTCDGMPLRLRVGMHAGPCIAMRANERIDYFGTTVNLAARLQSLANAGEVTMGKDDASRPDISPLLRAFAARATNEELAIKGFARPVEVVRLRVL